MREFKVGDRVVKNPENWIPNDFDRWGRGEGVGQVVDAGVALDLGYVDVRWPSGRCFEASDQLLSADEKQE